MNRLCAPWNLAGPPWAALLLCVAGAAGCGEPSCPAGSVSIGGRCEPAPACGPGEAEEGGVCIGGSDPDAGDGDGDGDEPGDGSTTDGENPDSDGMVTESTDPLCDAVDCGEHGVCTVVASEPACECRDGFAGAFCEECQTGLIAEVDACVEPCDASEAPDCGAHGSCEVDNGAAACACEHPYVGDACRDCAEGFALQSDGTCEADCGECGAHALCDKALMTPSCQCVAGYANEGDGCEWLGDGTTGGIVDRDLNAPEAWIVKDAEIADGELEFKNVTVDGICHLGSIEQVVRMPSFDDSEPLLLEIDARSTCMKSDPNSCPALLVDIGDKTTRLPVRGGPEPFEEKLSLCLTEAAYRDQVTVRVRPAFAAFSPKCEHVWPTIDRIAIRPASSAECPVEGELLGDLSGEQGWILNGSSISGGELALQSLDGASTLISVPEDGQIALEFSTSEAADTTLRIDGIEYLEGVSAQTTHQCLPSWTYGGVHRITFGQYYGGTSIDNLSVKRDSSCGGEFDAELNKPLNTGSWGELPSDSSAELAIGPDSRSAWHIQGASALAATVLIPGYEDETQAAAFSVTSREGASSASGTLSIQDITPGGLSTRTLMSTTHVSWTRDLICLDGGWKGQIVMLLIRGNASSNVSGTVPSFWVDQMKPVLVDAELCR